MLEDRKRPRLRNVRRGARSTLVFRVVISACVLGLFLAVWNVSGAVSGLREELAAGGGGGPSPAAPGAATESIPQAEDVEALQESLVELQSALTTARADQVRELAAARRQAAAERQELETRMAAKLEAMEARLVALGGRLADPEPVVGVDVVPPPEDGSEDPALVPSPPGTGGTGEEPVAGGEEPVGGGEEPVGGGEEPVGGGEEPEAGGEEPVGGGEEPVGGGEEPEPEFEEYTIRRGDTVSGIAVRFKVEMDELLELNGIEDPRRIQVGQVLRIPK